MKNLRSTQARFELDLTRTPLVRAWTPTKGDVPFGLIAPATGLTPTAIRHKAAS